MSTSPLAPLGFDEMEGLRAIENGPRSRDARSTPEPVPGLLSLLGVSPSMKSLFRQIEQAGPSAAAVLVVGETGTGKELVARTLHQLSSRKSRPYVAVNCAAMPETLVESELFGHEKGAFTGATSRSTGYFEQANRGTLFLDEISAMPISQQVKLLRTLQEGTVRRLGGGSEINVDVRVIAAMNVEPAKAMEEGRLRSDLYYRLSVFVLRVPPLRERPEDVLLLARHFAREFGESGERHRSIRFDAEASRTLERYAWPGNVRELRNAVERAAILAGDGPIGIDHLPPVISLADPAAISDSSDALDALDECPPLPTATEKLEPVTLDAVQAGMTLEEVKRRLILRTLDATGNNISEAARQLGISSRTIYNKIREWNLPPGELARSQ